MLAATHPRTQLRARFDLAPSAEAQVLDVLAAGERRAITVQTRLGARVTFRLGRCGHEPGCACTLHWEPAVQLRRG